MLNPPDVKRILEAALLSSQEPVNPTELKRLFDGELGELAGVGEKEKPGAIEVQPPDGDPAARREVRENRGTPPGVLARDKLPNRLVIHDDACLRRGVRADRLAVDKDGIGRRRPVAEPRGLTIQRDAPGGDPALDLAARSEARRSQELL